MQLTDIEFSYIPGCDYGTGVLTVTNVYDSCDFYFEFTAVQSLDCSYSSHSSTQIEPDEDYYEYDVIVDLALEALDYDSKFDMSGGLLVTAGSLGMVQTPSDSSSQYSMSIGFSSVQEAGTLVNISDEDGESILTFAPSKQYQSIVVCSPDLKEGTTYKISTGGSSTGEEKDGLYSNGKYSGGTEYDTAEISNSVTTVGTQGGMQGGWNMKAGGGRGNM